MTRLTLSMTASATVVLLGLSACTNPYDPGQRAVGGGLLGAGAGAAIGALAGGGRGAAIGALAGGSLGAVGGAATTPQGPGGYYAPPPPPPPRVLCPAAPRLLRAPARLRLLTPSAVRWCDTAPLQPALSRP